MQDFKLSLEEIKEINEQISQFENSMDKLNGESVLFFDAKEIQQITGWSKKTVEDLFNHPQFPCTNIGKRKLILKAAFIKFFMSRRCKEDELFWKY